MRVLLAQSFDQIVHVFIILQGKPQIYEQWLNSQYVLTNPGGVIFQKKTRQVVEWHYNFKNVLICLVEVGDLINCSNDPMALVGVGDVISSVEILVGVEDLINYIIFCIFVDLVIVEDWKIPAVLTEIRLDSEWVLNLPDWLLNEFWMNSNNSERWLSEFYRSFDGFCLTFGYSANR